MKRIAAFTLLFSIILLTSCGTAPEINPAEALAAEKYPEAWEYFSRVFENYSGFYLTATEEGELAYFVSFTGETEKKYIISIKHGMTYDIYDGDGISFRVTGVEYAMHLVDDGLGELMQPRVSSFIENNTEHTLFIYSEDMVELEVYLDGQWWEAIRDEPSNASPMTKIEPGLRVYSLSFNVSGMESMYDQIYYTLPPGRYRAVFTMHTEDDSINASLIDEFYVPDGLLADETTFVAVE